MEKQSRVWDGECRWQEDRGTGSRWPWERYGKPSTPAHRLTHQDGVDHRIPDDKRLHLEGFAERGCLVHSPHGSGFIGIDVLPQLFPVNVPRLRTIHLQPGLARLPSALLLLRPHTHLPTAFSSTSCTLGTRVAPPTRITCSISSCRGRKWRMGQFRGHPPPQQTLL